MRTRIVVIVYTLTLISNRCWIIIAIITIVIVIVGSSMCALLPGLAIWLACVGDVHIWPV